MLPALRRCNVTDLRSGLEGIASILVEARLYLDALPVISLWEHLTLHVMRNLKATVLCRCVCLCVYMPMCVLMCLPSACEINSPCACVVQPSGGGVSLSSMTMLISHRSRLCLSLFNYA